MYKPYWLYQLVSLGYRQIIRTLPVRFWKAIRVEETSEPLVLVHSTERITTGVIHKKYQASYVVRAEVARRLEIAAQVLPHDMKLVLIEGYRSIKNQQSLWDEKVAHLRAMHPKLSDREIQTTLVQVIARPSELSNHNCGGAVDVTLMYRDGTLVDMGSEYPAGDSTNSLTQELSRETASCYPMFSQKITQSQKQNRAVLRSAMEHAGFVWYPGEWWHYCYNDRMWAVYSNKSSCGYGPINRITTQIH